MKQSSGPFLTHEGGSIIGSLFRSVNFLRFSSTRLKLPIISNLFTHPLDAEHRVIKSFYCIFHVFKAKVIIILKMNYSSYTDAENFPLSWH